MSSRKDEDWEEMEASDAFSTLVPEADSNRVWLWYQKLRDDGKLRKRDIGLICNLVNAAYLAGKAVAKTEE